MKKAKMKLQLNKRNISSLKLAAVKGGITGTTCEFTNRYFKTCQVNCPTFNPNCIGSQSICEVTTC